MKPASSFFALVLLGSLIANAAAQTPPRGPRHQPPHQQPPQHQPSPGQSQIISERIMQMVRMHERLRVSELLRLSPGEEHLLQARSLTLLASSPRGPVQVDILSLGRSTGAPQIVRRQQSEVRVQLPLGTQIADLEISVSDDLMLDTITAEVESSYSPGPIPGQQVQPFPGQMLKLDVRRDVRGAADISLEQIAQQQLGLTLEGSQIERVVLLGSVVRGYSATAQVLMDGRLVGPIKSIGTQLTTPIPLRSFEEVRRDLRLIIRGDVIIQQINIVVGNVRPIQQRAERIFVGREISAGRPLQLGQLLPYEQRQISSIALEARSLRTSQEQVALLSLGSQVLATAIVSQIPMRPVLQLMRPMSARELSLQSFSPVIIESIEVEFERFRVW
jgi:hypothetical protein